MKSIKVIKCFFIFLAFNILTAYAQSNSCDVVGGGKGYRNILNKENVNYITANNFTELKTYINDGYKYIYIPNNVVINIPNQANALSIKNGQTIFSDRGINGDQGALLKVNYKDDNTNEYPVIRANSNSRITGLRIEGPYKESDTNNKTIGIQTIEGSTDIMIDNNELFGWPWASISVKTSNNIIVSNNYIHHNIKFELGYGVVVQNGNATSEIECNVFNYNRHAIAGSGAHGEGYYAHHNLVLNGGDLGAYHQFDMHKDPYSGVGGKFVKVTNNWFDYGRLGTSNRQSILIRAIPTNGPIIAQNNFFSQDYYVGNHVAIGGVNGSIPSKEEILTNNKFNMPMTYHKNNDICYLDFNHNIQNINCEVITK